MNDIKLPGHIGLILDGNRRWAREKGLPTLAGHKKGFEKIDTVKEFFNRGVGVVSLYAFSTENWKRSEKEVSYLMELLELAVEREIKKADKSDIKVLISGRIDELPGNIPQRCRELMEVTRDNKGGTLNFCINYGGRAEIVDGIKELINKGYGADDITEDLISSKLYNDLPDLDLVIRTSGERRISGFQIWRGAYTEYLFLEKNWPDFTGKDVDLILEDYARRKRRFGGDK